MRPPLAVLRGICLAWFASSSSVAAVWHVDTAVVMGDSRDARIETELSADVRAVSARDDRSAWVAAGDAVRLLSQDGHVLVDIDTAGAGFGRAELIATNVYDGSVWISTDQSVLLHFAGDGVLEQGTTLATKADAIAIDLDESVWVAASDRLLHFSSDGQWLRTQPLAIATDERVTALATDALRERLWIATTGGLRVLAVGESRLDERIVDHGVAGPLAIDPVTGIAMAVVDGTLVAVDADRDVPLVHNMLFDEYEHPLAVGYDAADRSFIIDTDKARLRLASDGTLLGRQRARDALLHAATPFRLDPTLTLLRPPDGGALTNPTTEIVLRVEGLCNGNRCELPPAYFRRLRVEAALGGVPLGPPSIDETGRAVFGSHPALRAGGNELSARVTDVFGHRAILGHARWTLIAGDEPASSVLSAATQSGATVDKAANKAPTVTLSQPSNGSVFSVGNAIQLAATAADADGTIAKVEFYRGGTTLIGTATSSPYQFVWTNATAGSYSLTAKAYDNKNGTAVSTAVTISIVNNQPPSVTLVTPSGGSFARAGESVMLEATASDSDGTIASVEFLDGNASLGVIRAAPYRLSWTPAVAGMHSIGAKATDDRGATSLSPVADVLVGTAPIIVVTGPVACSTIDGPTDVMLTADAMSASGAIASVQFFDNGMPIGTASAVPWRTTLANAAVGNHVITAKATDDRGSTAMSRPVPFTVHARNQPPTVALTAPADGIRLPYRATINVAATAADPDGVVTAVEFRLGSATGPLIGRASQAPYATAWTNVDAGSYVIVAVAFDDRSASTTSAPIHVTVDPNALPSVTLTAPLADAQSIAGIGVPLAASAADSDGNVLRVDFYAGTTLIGTSTAAPYAAVWTPASPGAYSLTAKAMDNAGGVSTSAAVPVTVVADVPPTVSLTAASADGDLYAPATIALTADAQDSDGSIVAVDFYAGAALIAHSSAPPYRFVWDAVPAGSYALTAKATDDAGSVASSSPVTVTIAGGPSISIDPALSGATIDDDNVLIGGVVSAPANAAVTVNGVVTHIDDLGRFSANELPLVPGANAVTVEVTTQNGQSTTQSIVVNSSGTGAFVVRAAPTEGLETLQVTFTIDNPANTPFKQMRLDLDNDGTPNLILTPEQFVDGKLTVTATYPEGTWLAVLKAYDDQDRVIYATSRSIVVRIPQILQGKLLAIYDGMLARLRAGNIPGALTAFTGSAYERHSEIFTQLQSSLAQIVDQLGEVKEVTFNEDVAELTVVRDTPDGPLAFLIYMLRSEDGIWRVDGM